MAMTGGYTVRVTHANGRKTVHGAVVAGAILTAEALSDHYIRHNAFPGAKEVEIFESDEALPKDIEDVLKRARGQSTLPNARPLTTPKAKIVRREGAPVPKAPTLLIDGDSSSVEHGLPDTDAGRAAAEEGASGEPTSETTPKPARTAQEAVENAGSTQDAAVSAAQAAPRPAKGGRTL